MLKLLESENISLAYPGQNIYLRPKLERPQAEIMEKIEEHEE